MPPSAVHDTTPHADPPLHQGWSADQPGQPEAAQGSGGAARHSWRPLLVRIHFYAGVLVGPFVAVLLLTGMAYALTPQLDRVFYAEQLSVDPAGRTPLPLTRVVATAEGEAAGLRMVALRLPSGPDGTVRVEFADPALGDPMAVRTVYVDPYTATSRGQLVTRHGSTPLTSWIGQLHGDLHLGEPGRLYAELATVWLLVLLLGGLLLWWERVRRHHRGAVAAGRALFLVRRSDHGLHRSIAWHSVLGSWVLPVGLVMAFSGVMIASYSGPRWSALMSGLQSAQPRIEARLPGPSGAGHSATAGIDVDGVRAAAATAGITEDVRLTPPTRPGTGWVASENRSVWPVAADQAVIDPGSGEVVRTIRFEQWPVLAKVYRLALWFHFGRLFGPLTQVLLLVGCLALLVSTVWGYRMWWQRRPHLPGFRMGRPPRRGAWRSVSRPALVLGLVVAPLVLWGLPVLAVSAVGFVLLDGLIGRYRGRRAGRPQPRETASA